ncbi:MAG: type I pullulanase [Bacillota bacterium]|nr:type I pullulanase [Bacillota bacterium]
MYAMERPFLAYLDEMNIVTILLPNDYHNGISTSFFLSCGLQYIPLEIKEKHPIEHHMKYICAISFVISFEKTYWILDEFEGKTDLQFGAVIRTEVFDELFFYEGNDLGVQCLGKKTQFKLWAPTAAKVDLNLYSPSGDFSESFSMKREEKGVWTAYIHKDLEYYQYTFLVCVNQEFSEAVDPYAKAVTPNGERGVVVKMEKTHLPKPILQSFEHPVDAVIYETHIRDFTIHPNSGVKHKGLYLGAGEKKTSGIFNQLTGLSYLKDLGITHIEFLPFHDFAGVDEVNDKNEYNWGYNPVHFNVPEGSYSTDPVNPYTRIREIKQCIEQIHKASLRVIMDAVYNHVYQREQSHFEKIVPGYYFRHNEFGLPSNGTGVGNDIASERKMVRKYILDSIRFWINEYHIDGIRFDLMGIMDVDTINEIKEMCDSLSDGMLLVGEGWTLNTPLPENKKATILNQANLPEIGQFNDLFRDSIKGSTFNLYDKGYAFGNEHYFEMAKEVIAGSIGFHMSKNALFKEPFQSVNYVECHDNHTLWDKICSCFPNEDESLLMKYHRLATSIVLLSQGIPFLHSGQEFFRTKSGIGNSYKSPDIINQLDWDRKWKYSKNVEYMKGIIKLRKTLPCFRMRSKKEICENMVEIELPSPIIGFSYRNPSSIFFKIHFYINPSLVKYSINVDTDDWYLLADEHSTYLNTNHSISAKEIVLEPVSLTILGKK